MKVTWDFKILFLFVNIISNSHLSLSFSYVGRTSLVSPLHNSFPSNFSMLLYFHLLFLNSGTRVLNFLHFCTLVVGHFLTLNVPESIGSTQFHLILPVTIVSTFPLFIMVVWCCITYYYWFLVSYAIWNL